MSDGLTNVPTGGHWAEDDVSGGSSRGPARMVMDWGGRGRRTACLASYKSSMAANMSWVSALN